MKSIPVKLALALSSFLIFAFVADFSVRLYVTYYLGFPKTYQYDPILGYRAIPLNDCKRKIRGEDYSIHYLTNSRGIRVAREDSLKADATIWHRGRRRVLVAGDSFAEGTVNYADRFDNIINQNSDIFSVVSIGVGGYGTDQQLLLAKEFFEELQENDVFVLLTCGNDFQDILRKRSFGRLKPYYSTEGSAGYRLHLPHPNFLDRLRDRSYILGYYLQTADQMIYDLSDAQIEESKKLYRYLVRHSLEPLKSKGVNVIVAHHSDRIAGDISSLFVEIESDGITVLNLDEYLHTESDLFINDNYHWNEKGYIVVANALLKILEETDNNPIESAL